MSQSDGYSIPGINVSKFSSPHGMVPSWFLAGSGHSALPCQSPSAGSLPLVATSRQQDQFEYGSVHDNLRPNG